MKKNLMLIGILLLTACGSIRYERYEIPEKKYVIELKPTVYSIMADSSVGSEVSLNLKLGDSLIAYGLIKSGLSSYYLTEINNTNYYISKSNLGSECQLKKLWQSTTFSIDKSKQDIYWSRAVTYIQKHSDMKIQTQNDYLIETYNPIGKEVKIGFSITKEITEEGAKIKVKCITNNPFYSIYDMERSCAYYILYGEECY